MDTQQAVRIVQVINHWPKLGDLAVFATQRHGYSDDNGGFGIIYPGDVREYGREVGGAEIPTGHVEVYGLLGRAKRWLQIRC